MDNELYGVCLTDVFQDKEFCQWVQERNGRFRFIVYQGMSAMDESIDFLELSVRGYNALKRSGFSTINEVVDAVENQGDLIRGVRNMGRKTAQEVMFKIFVYNYRNLPVDKRRAYADKIRELN